MFTNFSETLTWVYDVALLPVGAVLLSVLLLLIRRALRKATTDRIAVNGAVLIASAFSAEGMFEVATDPEGLALPWYIAIGLFLVAEAAMLAEAARAKRLHEETESLGRHGRAVWTIAVCAGFIVALNSASLVEVPIRFGMPVLVAALWWLGYQGDEATAARSADAITWRISPRRILVWLRLAEPGERDVIEVDRARRIASLTTVAHGLHHGSQRKLVRRWRLARLRRLTLAADDGMVAEVRERITRVAWVEKLTAPDTVHEHPAVNTTTSPDDTLTEPAVNAPADGDVNTAPEPPKPPARKRTPKRKPSGPKPRKTFTDYLTVAQAALTPTTVITAAWVREVTGCSRGLSSKLAAHLKTTTPDAPAAVNTAAAA